MKRDLGVEQKIPTVTVNREYKDTIFRMLFSDKQNLLSLYNAMNGTGYNQPEALEIVTLENAIYMNMKNDLAFILDFHLYLYEHQASYNPNMPLRDFFYISNEYQMLVDKKSLYSSTIQKIPTPKFVVFYNGTQKAEEAEVISMSIFEYDKEKEERLLREAEYEAGKADGLEQAKKIFKLNMDGKTILEIATECEISEDEVKKILQ